jgi:hypothetical protein
MLLGSLTFRMPQSVEVSWRPPQTHLHYNALYCGIYEYLRAPPDPDRRAEAVAYLMDLQENSIRYPLIPQMRVLQEHRILWVLEWLGAMPEDCASDADTVERAEL